MSKLTPREFLEAMKKADKSHGPIFSGGIAIQVLTVSEDPEKETDETLAPLPKGSQIWLFAGDKEKQEPGILFFKLPGKEPFRVENVVRYTIDKVENFGLVRAAPHGQMMARLKTKDKHSVPNSEKE